MSRAEYSEEFKAKVVREVTGQGAVDCVGGRLLSGGRRRAAHTGIQQHECSMR